MSTFEVTGGGWATQGPSKLNRKLILKIFSTVDHARPQIWLQEQTNGSKGRLGIEGLGVEPRPQNRRSLELRPARGFRV